MIIVHHSIYLHNPSKTIWSRTADPYTLSEKDFIEIFKVKLCFCKDAIIHVWKFGDTINSSLITIMECEICKTYIVSEGYYNANRLIF